MVSIMLTVLISTYPWPIRSFGSAHQVSATLGDARDSLVNPRFHRGIDIPAGLGTEVYSIISTDSAIVLIDPPNSYVVAGDHWYIHITPSVEDGDSVLGILDTVNTPPDTIGKVLDYPPSGPQNDHLHFQIDSAGPAEGPFYNPLSYNGGPVGYTDNGNPTVSFDFWRQGSEGTTAQQLDSIFDGKVDIRAYCQDTQTSGGGNNTSGIYRCLYLIADTLGNVLHNSDTTIRFPQVQPPNNGAPVLLVYDRHNYRTASPFYYWATNRIVNNQVEDRYWNTKQKADSAGIPFPDSVDADSIENAKFKDGFFWVKVYAYDIKNKADSESVYVHVDNFYPRVDVTYPDNWYHWIAEDEKEVWCTFSEAIDTATLIPANITIRSFVDTSHYYPIINITYVDSLFKLILEVDSFDFHDEVQVQLSDSIMDLAGKSLEQGGGKEKGVAYSWKFTVGVIKLTDNDIMDFRPDIYGDKIAWVEVHSQDSSNINLHDLTSHTTSTLNTGSGFHNWPIVWKNQVAWRQEIPSTPYYRDRIYYFDGSSTQLVVSENLARNQYDFDSCGIVMYSSVTDDGLSPDTIWVQHYIPGSGLSLLDTYTVQDYFSRNVDIDGSEIVWEHGQTSGDRRGYGISGSLQSSIIYERGHESRMRKIGQNKETDMVSRDTYTKDIYLRGWFGQMNLTSMLDSSINAMPSLSQGQSAWMRYTWNKDTLAIATWVYDGAGGRQLSILPYIDYSIYWPEMQNGDVMWYDFYAGTGLQRLHYYDGWQDNILASGFSTSDFVFWNWQVENGQAVWLQLSTSYKPTYYDGEQIVTLVERDSTSNRIGISDGLVVYDAWDGHDNEIYVYIGDTLKTPPYVAKNLRNEILATDEQASKNMKEIKSQTREDTQVMLLWSPNTEPDLAGYNIYRSETAYTYGTIPYGTVTATDTIFLDTLPLVNKNYYVVTAFDDLNNESGFSNQTLADLTPDTIPPSAPTNLVAVCDPPYQAVDLTWDASPEPDVGMYRIYRADSSGGYSTPLDSVADSVTTYADSTIIQGMTYYYVATAVDTNSNESGYSNEDSVIVPDTTPPSAPTNFVATYDSIEQVVDLSWSGSPEPDLGLYRIYRSGTSGSYTTPLDSVQEPTTTFVDSTILFDTTYYYVVTAVDTNSNESGYSNEDTVVVPDTTPPSPPTNLVAIYDSISQVVSLDWSAPSDPDVEQYRVYRSEISGSYSTPLDSVSANDTTFTDSTIALGNTFYYVVTAVDSSNNESNYSNEDTVDVPVRFMSYYSLASAYNNGFRMVRNSATEKLFLGYAMSDSTALCTSTDDEGTTWSRSAFVGPGSFPSMALDSDTNLHCVFCGMVDMDFLGRSSGSRTSGHNAQDTQTHGFSAELVHIERIGQAVPEPSMPGDLLGHRTLYYTVGYAWYSNDTWQNTSIYETQDSILSVCFAIDPLDTAWVVFNTYDSQASNRLKIGKFYTQTTPDSLQNVTNLDTYSSKGMTAIAIRSSDRSIWLVYERDGTIKCKKRDSTGTWGTHTVQTEGIYPTLSIGEAGSLIHFIWEKYYSETDTREIQTCYTNGRLWTMPQKIAQVKNEHCYPFIEKGAIAVWHDLDYPYWDVFSSQRTESDTWTTPENITNSADDSKHPQVVLYQTGSQTKFTYVWTEGSESPYELKVQIDSSSSDFVPLYAFDLGQEEACIFSEKRDGHVKYGNGCEETADFDRDCLHYRITGLNPNRIYKLRLVASQSETDALWRQAVEIDDCSTLDIELGRNDILTEDIMLSQECYQDGAVDVKIKNVVGPKVVLSAMSVWEYDQDYIIIAGSSGPQSNNNEPAGLICFGGVYPNPGKYGTKIKLNAPYECNVSVRLYDVSGRMVDEIFNGKINGLHEIPVVSEETASGVYFVRIETDKQVITEKVILLR